MYSDVFDLIQAYRKYDPAAKSDWEVLFLYPGIKSIGLHRIAHFFYTMNFFFIARFVSELSRWLTGIEIHPGAKIGKRLIIDHGMGIVIGETSIVGDDCIIFHNVTLGGIKFTREKRHPTIGDQVLIGTGAKILGNVIIGDRAKIGAGAVVLKNVSADQVVIGSV
jgi:serine O-acetyltransferase